MLEELLIRDVGVIEEITLDLADGLNVLTGETGAGKTIVVSSLELLLGARADADQVRLGARTALVEGRFRPVSGNAAEWLAGDNPDDASMRTPAGVRADTDGWDDELIVSREVVAGDGAGARSRARLGGRLAPASALVDVVGGLIEVHGQSAAVRMAEPRVQRDLLDRFGGERVEQAAGTYRDGFQRWRTAAGELEELRAGERDRARDVDRLDFELAEIDAVAPVAGEEEQLTAELRRLEHAESLIAAAAQAGAALNIDGGARDGLGSCVAALRAAGGVDEQLDALGKRAEGLAAETQELGLELQAYAADLDLDPARLEVLRERRAALAGLVRKYGADTAAVLAYAGQARARLERLRGGDERAGQLESEVAALQDAVAIASERLSDARRTTGARLAAAVEVHLADLALADARMEVRVEPAQPGPDGADRVTFLLAAGAGQPLLPVAKAASGGERSRLALALRLALTDADETAVLVFDEVDAGIGGSVALAVGEKLAHLARGRQVLCVTHLAQLAAYADGHFLVDKATSGGRTTATVRRLSDDQRIVELSRMLSGTPDSRVAVDHAAELRAAALSSLGR